MLRRDWRSSLRGTSGSPQSPGPAPECPPGRQERLRFVRRSGSRATETGNAPSAHPASCPDPIPLCSWRCLLGAVHATVYIEGFVTMRSSKGKEGSQKLREQVSAVVSKCLIFLFTSARFSYGQSDREDGRKARRFR